MAFAGVIALVACEGVTETSLNQEAPVPSFSAGPVVQSVTGSGHFVYVKDFNYIRIFTDVGQRLADGTVRGQWERNMSHGVVTCMTIIGNQAWLGGYAMSGPFSTPPNNEVGWRVTDNGQGANTPPDEISLQWVGAEPGFAAAWCASPPGPEHPDYLRTWPITSGNIQVNP